MKITFAMIVFNGEMFLKQVLEQIYPFAHQIVISEGTVAYWRDKGFTTSTDGTNKILQEFPDPDGKITVVHGSYNEKTELCRAYMPYIKPDTDYLWTIDSDEVFKAFDIAKVITFLKTEKPGSVGFQSNTFFGGFNHILTGFERDHSFKRILKYVHGCTYVDHRPPTLSSETGPAISGKELFLRTGVEMYHYSYVSPKQVFEKIQYYKESLSKNNCIDNYFQEIWLAWVRGNDEVKHTIEAKWKGVHEFVPSYRGDCYTQRCTGEHPESIEASLPQLEDQFFKQLKQYL